MPRRTGFEARLPLPRQYFQDRGHLKKLVDSYSRGKGRELRYLIEHTCTVYARFVFFSGLGLSLIYISSIVVARNSFEGTSGDLAVNANIICIGVGILLYPYVFDRLMHTYTVNEVFLLLGGVYLNNIIVGFLFLIHERKSRRLTKSQSGTGEQTENSEDFKSSYFLGIRLTLVRIWKSSVSLMRSRYSFVLLGTVLSLSANQDYLIVFNDIYVWKGFTENERLMLFTSYNVSNAASRLLPSVVKKIKPNNNMMVLLTACALCGFVGQLCILLTSQVELAVVGNIVAGISQGGVISAATVAVSNLSTADTFSVAYGFLYTIIGILDFAIGVIFGYIRDSVQSYELAIILTAGMNGVGACLYIAAPLHRYCRKEPTVNISEETNSTHSDGVRPISIIISKFDIGVLRDYHVRNT